MFVAGAWLVVPTYVRRGSYVIRYRIHSVENGTLARSLPPSRSLR